jgi:hypothetical protein
MSSNTNNNTNNTTGSGVRRQLHFPPEPPPTTMSTVVECIMCCDEIQAKTNNATTRCGHTFCLNCLLRHLSYSNACPLCRAEIYFEPSQSAAMAQPAQEIWFRTAASIMQPPPRRNNDRNNDLNIVLFEEVDENRGGRRSDNNAAVEMTQIDYLLSLISGYETTQQTAPAPAPAASAQEEASESFSRASSASSDDDRRHPRMPRLQITPELTNAVMMQVSRHTGLRRSIRGAYREHEEMRNARARERRHGMQSPNNQHRHHQDQLDAYRFARNMQRITYRYTNSVVQTLIDWNTNNNVDLSELELHWPRNDTLHQLMDVSRMNNGYSQPHVRGQNPGQVDAYYGINGEHLSPRNENNETIDYRFQLAGANPSHHAVQDEDEDEDDDEDEDGDSEETIRIANEGADTDSNNGEEEEEEEDNDAASDNEMQQMIREMQQTRRPTIRARFHSPPSRPLPEIPPQTPQNEIIRHPTTSATTTFPITWPSLPPPPNRPLPPLPTHHENQYLLSKQATHHQRLKIEHTKDWIRAFAESRDQITEMITHLNEFKEQMTQACNDARCNADTDTDTDTDAIADLNSQLEFIQNEMTSLEEKEREEACICQLYENLLVSYNIELELLEIMENDAKNVLEQQA